MVRKRLSVLFLLTLVTLAGCKEILVAPTQDTATKEANEWVYENMETWYYWNDKLPGSPNYALPVPDFFNSLLYTFDASLRPDGDRFSWIEESAEELKAALSGETKTTGMEFRVVRYTATSNDLYGVVLYVMDGSPAAKVGMKRGDIFTRVNGQKLTVGNYIDLLYSDSPKTFTMGGLDAGGQVLETNVQRETNPIVFQENPVHKDTLLVLGSKRVGYLVYNQFIPGLNGSGAKEFDRQLERAFERFRTQNINELVIDFRYNGGGYISSATELASLIGSSITDKDVFYRKEYNKTITPQIEKQFGKSFFFENFKAKSQSVGRQINRVFILTSSRTASASELVINGLQPFMEVVVIGQRTAGKNVGSITISDDKKRFKWGLQPIVSKSFNSLNRSDYTSGFTPRVTVAEGVRLYSLGDPRDPLLSEALFLITGSRVARRGLMEDLEETELTSSIARKAAGGNMFFDQP